MIRVMVVEDSPTARALMVEILQSDPDIDVVGEAVHGAEAVEMSSRLRPDLITMDIHMPVMDGFTATKHIMARSPTPIIIVSSSTSGPDVEHSLNAIQAGALMLLPKPDNPASSRFDYRRTELVTMAKAMASVKVVRRWNSAPVAAPPRPQGHAGGTVRIVAIAASTGGPAALHRIFSSLPRDFRAPIVVVQHITAGFIGGLADWLRGSCPLEVSVAEHGEELRPGHVYLAPDTRHLGVTSTGRIAISDEPPRNGFRPSGDHLFESVAAAYGSSVAGIVLTGMGADGVEGLRSVKAAGGHVLAQDEASSIVYGMPKEAVAAGIVDAVLSLDDMAPRLVHLLGKNP
jgi:two-component system chemotaxis response regulator CheB